MHNKIHESALGLWEGGDKSAWDKSLYNESDVE